MSRWKLRAFFVIGLAFVGGVWWSLSREHAAVDACLDGGGRWDHATARCTSG